MNSMQRTIAIAIVAVWSKCGFQPITVRVWFSLALFDNPFFWRHNGKKMVLVYTSLLMDVCLILVREPYGVTTHENNETLVRCPVDSQIRQ